jgi:membrane-bound metal-dependent hydrolase YbcI (DUF457 family)
MLILGHIALGYITGKIISKATDQSINIPVIWILSLLPDIDLLIPGLRHRGPTHSIIVALIIFTPLFIIASWKAAPYFAALVSHSLIGDYFTGGAQMFWPLSSEWLEYERSMRMGSALELSIALALFTVMIAILILSREPREA